MTTFSQTLAGSDNDGREAQDGTAFSATSTTNAHDSNSATGSRFNTLLRFTSPTFSGTIDAGTNVQLFITSTDEDDVALDWHYEDIDNPGDLASNADITDRSRSATSVAWVADGIGSGYQTSPELQTLFQALVDNRAFGTAFALLMIGRATPDRVSRSISVDNGAAVPAILTVEFTAGASATRRYSLPMTGVG